MSEPGADKADIIAANKKWPRIKDWEKEVKGRWIPIDLWPLYVAKCHPDWIRNGRPNQKQPEAPNKKETEAPMARKKTNDSNQAGLLPVTADPGTALATIKEEFPEAAGLLDLTPATGVLNDRLGVLQAYANNKVVDQESGENAAKVIRLGKAYIEDVEAAFKKPKSMAHKIHRFFSGLESSFVDAAQTIVDHNAREALRYDNEQRRKAQEEADRRRLEEQKRQAAEAAARQQKAADEFDPFSDDAFDPFAAASHAPEPAPPPIVPAVPVETVNFSSFGLKKKQGRYFGVVDDAKAVLLAAMGGNEDAMSVITIDQVALNKLAQKYEERLSDFVPGTRADREEGLSR